MPVARDAGHVTKNFPRAIKVPINQTREQLPAPVASRGRPGRVQLQGLRPAAASVSVPRSSEKGELVTAPGGTGGS